MKNFGKVAVGVVGDLVSSHLATGGNGRQECGGRSYVVGVAGDWRRFAHYELLF